MRSLLFCLSLLLSARVVVYTANLSALSFSWIPIWVGTQHGVNILLKFLLACRIFWIIGVVWIRISLCLYWTQRVCSWLLLEFHKFLQWISLYSWFTLWCTEMFAVNGESDWLCCCIWFKCMNLSHYSFCDSGSKKIPQTLSGQTKEEIYATRQHSDVYKHSEFSIKFFVTEGGHKILTAKRTFKL